MLSLHGKEQIFSKLSFVVFHRRKSVTQILLASKWWQNCLGWTTVHKLLLNQQPTMWHNIIVTSCHLSFIFFLWMLRWKLPLQRKTPSSNPQSLINDAIYPKLILKWPIWASGGDVYIWTTLTGFPSIYQLLVKRFFRNADVRVWVGSNYTEETLQDLYSGWKKPADFRNGADLYSRKMCMRSERICALMTSSFSSLQ